MKRGAAAAGRLQMGFSGRAYVRPRRSGLELRFAVRVWSRQRKNEKTRSMLSGFLPVESTEAVPAQALGGGPLGDVDQVLVHALIPLPFLAPQDNRGVRGRNPHFSDRAPL